MNVTQCKMARAGLNWSLEELAKKAGLGYATIARFETGGEARASSVSKMRAAMELAGVKFIDSGVYVGGVWVEANDK